MPKVSVIIPAYNSAHLVRYTVDSVLNQDYTDYEVIVVDDGSTDQTRQVLAGYGDRIRYIYQENKRHSGARNTGILAARGEYLAFVDSDDLWHPEKLRKQAAILDAHPEVVLVCTQARYVDMEGEPVKLRGKEIDGPPGKSVVIRNYFADLFMGDVIPGGGSSSMARRQAVLEAGMFDPAMDYAEEWDVWIRLAPLGLFAYVPEPLTLFRISGWEKSLRREASETLITRPLRLIERAKGLWKGDPAEAERLARLGTARLWTRAALASFQLGDGQSGRAQLEKAIGYDLSLSKAEALFHLALDRARLIRVEYETFSLAEEFLDLFFTHLPPNALAKPNTQKKALAWLYLSDIFENRENGQEEDLRRLYFKAVKMYPGVIRNRGAASLGIELLAGRELKRWMGKPARTNK